MKIGDTVWLKSGGPAMTIYEIVGREAGCVWAGGGRGQFPMVALSINPPPPAAGAPRREGSAPAPAIVTERNYGDWPPDSVEKLGADP